MIKEAIKKFTSINIVDEHKEEFEEEQIDINLLRGKIMSIFLIAVEMITIVIFVIKNPVMEFESIKSLYFLMYLLFIAAMSALLILINHFSKNKVKNIKKIFVLTYSVAAFILLRNMVITLLDQIDSGSLLSYFMALIGISIIIYIKPRVLISIYVCVQILFIVLLPFFLPEEEKPFSAYINTSIAVFIAWLLGYLIYKGKAINFFQRKVIEKKNSQLNQLNMQLQETNKSLEYLSQTDGLTGIYNRRMFNKLSNQYWDNCIKAEHELTVIMMDIDHFKEYNDNFGHQSGDDCLLKLVDMLQKTLNEFKVENKSMLARYGGEEFVLMVCGLNKEDSYKLAETARKSVEKLNIKRKFTEVAGYITLSLGVFTGVPANALSSCIAEYIGKADKALYDAKNAGRNLTKIYE